MLLYSCIALYLRTPDLACLMGGLPLLPDPFRLAHNVILIERLDVGMRWLPAEPLRLLRETPRVCSAVILGSPNLLNGSIVFVQLLLGKAIGLVGLCPSVLMHRPGNPLGRLEQLVFARDSQVVSVVPMRAGFQSRSVDNIEVRCEIIDVDVGPNVET